jgi:hypothetical protein
MGRRLTEGILYLCVLVDDNMSSELGVRRGSIAGRASISGSSHEIAYICSLLIPIIVSSLCFFTDVNETIGLGSIHNDMRIVYTYITILLASVLSKILLLMILYRLANQLSSRLLLFTLGGGSR